MRQKLAVSLLRFASRCVAKQPITSRNDASQHFLFSWTPGRLAESVPPHLFVYWCVSKLCGFRSVSKQLYWITGFIHHQKINRKLNGRQKLVVFVYISSTCILVHK
jgi:hypothetical protein